MIKRGYTSMIDHCMGLKTANNKNICIKLYEINKYVFIIYKGVQ